MKYTVTNSATMTKIEFDLDGPYADKKGEVEIDDAISKFEDSYKTKPKAMLVPIETWVYLIEKTVREKPGSGRWRAGDHFNSVAIYPCDWIKECKPLADFNYHFDKWSETDAMFV